jgi:hypothetical protein
MSDITKAVIAGYSAAYIEEACNFLSAMSEAELDDAGPEYQRLFGYALAIRGALRQMEAALEQSVEVIKTWHNMDGSDHVWGIYYRNAPEMKAIREALTP